MYAIYDVNTRKILATGDTRLKCWESLLSGQAPVPTTAKAFRMSPALAAAVDCHGFDKLTCVIAVSGSLALPCEALGCSS